MACSVLLAGLLQRRAGDDELAVPLDRRRRPVGGEQPRLQRVDILAERAQLRRARRRWRRRRRQSVQEVDEATLGMGGAKVIQPVLRLGVPSVLETGVVRLARLHEGELGQRPRQRRPDGDRGDGHGDQARGRNSALQCPDQAQGEHAAGLYHPYPPSGEAAAGAHNWRYVT